MASAEVEMKNTTEGAPKISTKPQLGWPGCDFTMNFAHEVSSSDETKPESPSSEMPWTEMFSEVLKLGAHLDERESVREEEKLYSLSARDDSYEGYFEGDEMSTETECNKYRIKVESHLHGQRVDRKAQHAYEMGKNWVKTVQIYAQLQAKFSDTTSTVKEKRILRTKGDGLCLIRAVVGSYNLQLKPDILLSVTGVSRTLYEYMMKHMDYYTETTGMNKAAYVKGLCEYFVHKKYDQDVVDLMPYALSSALSVNLEIIRDGPSSMTTQIVTDASFPTILVHKTPNHYSQMMVVDRITRRNTSGVAES